MKKSELKSLIKPLIKECIHEVLLEEGVLSNVVSEVVKGVSAAPIVENHQAPQAKKTKRKIAEHRQKMRDAIGRKSDDGDE